MTECRPVWAAAPADVHFHTTQSEMKKRKVKKKKISTVHPILCRGKSSKGKKKLKGADYCFQYFYFSFLPSSFSARERERSLKVIWLRVVVHPPSPPTIEKRGTNSKGGISPKKTQTAHSNLKNIKLFRGFSLFLFLCHLKKKKKSATVSPTSPTARSSSSHHLSFFYCGLRRFKSLTNWKRPECVFFLF